MQGSTEQRPDEEHRSQEQGRRRVPQMDPRGKPIEGANGGGTTTTVDTKVEGE